MGLVFDQWPYLQDGWLTWSAKNDGTSTVPAGTAIGEWEMWDSSDTTRTVIPREVVASKETIEPGDVEWAQVWVQMAPEPGFAGQGKLVIQLGTDITDVAYDWTVSWRMVDEGWGRKAVDFATFAEPCSSREYVFVHSRLGVGPEDTLLDVACGSGLALELARMRGAECAGIDASKRLVEIARDRNPGSDVRVGDMHDLPWDDESFDVATSFRGIWGTTPGVLAEVRRVLRPGGRVAMTVWGDVGKSPGAWMFLPFRWAHEAKVDNQAQMVSLGRPGVGEAFLTAGGFRPQERFVVPFFMEYADPDAYARALASSGPAFESIQNIGEVEFHERAAALAAEHVREGLPLRGEIQLFGYIGVKQ